MHASVGRALRTAWDLHSEATAKRALERLARSLEDEHPGAAASIREGLDETLTVLRLGLTGPLQRTLPHDEHHREPQLRGGALHAQREALARRSDDSALGGECATGSGTALRRVRGYRDMHHLVAALDALAPPAVGVEQVA